MRRGQYTLITFIVATFVLLSLTGIVSNLLTDKEDQIKKANTLVDLSERVTMMRSVLTQERQVGVDFTSLHLGLIGGWPRGSSQCGTLINDSASWLIKQVPYWYSDPDTAEFYSFESEVYSGGSDFEFITFNFNNLRNGLYEMFDDENSVVQPPFILDGKVITDDDSIVRTINGNTYYELESGTHQVLITEKTVDLCDYSLCTGGAVKTSFDSLPNSLSLKRYIPYAEISFSSGETTSIIIDGVEHSNQEPGINTVLLDSFGQFIESNDFNTGSIPGQSQALINYLEGLSDGNVIVISIQGDAVSELSQDARNALSDLGSDEILGLLTDEPWGFIGIIGAGKLAEGATGSFEFSEYSVCIPNEEFLIGVHELFLNKYFQVMSELALEQIVDLTSISSFRLSNMALLTYESEIESIGRNSIFITFFPTNLPYFKVDNNAGMSNASYSGSPIIFDAFESDFALFRSITNELISEKRINSLINSLIERHSSFIISATIMLRGSTNPDYESFFDDWSVTGTSPAQLDTSAFEGLNIKPNCIYYLREACQLLSDEVPTGYHNDIYVNQELVDDGLADEGDLYQLYKDFTVDRLPDGWSDALESCRACHDVGRFNNPCVNLSENERCLECFEDLTGTSYDSVTSASFDLNSGELTSVEDDVCYALIQSEIKPLIEDYIIYRFNDLEQELNELYDVGWRLDAERINVTSIEFSGLTGSENHFNSSCYDCRSVTFNSQSNCKLLESDLELVDATLSTTSALQEALGEDEVVFSDELNFLQADDSIKPIKAELTVRNKGNTVESVYVTVLIDAYANLLNYDGYGALKYYSSDFGNPLTDLLPSDLSLSGNPSLDDTYGDFGVDFDGLWDFRIEQGVVLEGMGFSTIPINIDELFTPADMGLTKSSHLVRICVHTAFNDEWDWTNNCIDFTVGVCSDGDLSRACCTNDEFQAVWLESTPYGVCCGDDNDFRDSFLADLNNFCYLGIDYNCQADGPIAANVRPITENRNYDLSSSDYIDYYCTGHV